MKTLLRVESLEPRALLAGLCDLTVTAPPAPLESMPAAPLELMPAAEVGPMRGGAESSPQATPWPSMDVDIAPPQGASPGSSPPVNSPSDPTDSKTDQTPPHSPLEPPSEPDLTTPKSESGSTDHNSFKGSDVAGDTGSSATTDALSPSCAADPGFVSKSTASPAPFADLSTQANTPAAPSFVSLFVTASSTSQEKQFGPSAAVQGNSTDDPSAFHYFEPIGASRHDGVNFDSEPLANTAVRQTFVAFWLMTKKDLEDLQGQSEAIDTAAATASATPSATNADNHQVDKGTTAVTDQTDVVYKALAAISSVDDVIRQADAACALASSRTAELTSITEAAIAQALASSATKSNQPTSPQAAASEPSSPRWQLGMCSLVSILFSFRAPTKCSDKLTAPRKSLFRALQRTT